MSDENNDLTTKLGKNAISGVSAVRSQSRESRNPERGRRVKVGLLDTDKIHRMKRGKVEKFSAPGLKTFGIRLKNPEGVRGKRKQEVYENSHKHEGLGRGKGKRYEVAGNRVRNLQTRVWWERCTGIGERDGPGLRYYTSWRSPKRKTQCW